MRRWLKTGVVTLVTLLSWLMVAVPAFAGSGVTAGARSSAGGETARSIPDESAQSIPSPVQEVTASFTATPTTGGLGDAVEASRTTFSTSETIEFNAVLNETGLAGTKATITIFVLDSRGVLVAGGFVVGGVVAPSDRTGLFMQLSSGSLPAGHFTWLMVIGDAFGNNFITPYQVLVVQ